ncbi:DNA modification methylase [Halogranum amylolyticum]|uniref:Type II methyltransferase n=1 Tax=Halogranum amylolyticum TaxID=660520 RepID=A0A1H8PMQ7_9EURY|nr:site-specific DNA-methyltransferase [Halogranum amylolyticum]SEO42984.1 DNA modification methylase [Halogranum amylolyticum]
MYRVHTNHVLRAADATDMSHVADESVDLVITSPPYPMIEMWDELFTARDPAIADALADGDGDAAFERMHAQLDDVWDEVARVLAPGGIVCVNVGDAVRSFDDGFRQFPNHARVIEAFDDRGLRSLPDILWRKPTNRLTKFMGSGMLPPSAYVTLEHEYVLVFRKGEARDFPPSDPERYASAFFWEERNEWFSDLWSFTGTDQTMEATATDDRERSAAFPLELPLRLVRMYSTYGDTVLDPFAGTGTTTLAAMHAGRDSVGYELDADLVEGFDERTTDLPTRSRRRTRQRLERHRSFVADRDPDYEAVHYDVPVVTQQERQIRLYAVTDVARATVGADEDGDVAAERAVPDGQGVEGSHGDERPHGEAYDETRTDCRSVRYRLSHTPLDELDESDADHG